MHVLLYFFVLFTTATLFSQNMKLAQSYYDTGEFTKAVLSYEKLYKKNPKHSSVILPLAKSYVQLNRYDDAIALLEKSYTNSPRRLEYLIEMGVIYKQQNYIEKANEIFKEFQLRNEEQPSRSTVYAQYFKDHNLLEQAIHCYKSAMTDDVPFDYNYEIGMLYGELGNYKEMFSSYIDYMEANRRYVPQIKRRLDEFITEDPEEENNELFRRVLLRKIQQDPNVFYNELLSWLFVQQKQFRKAFLQEKAIYAQTGDGVLKLINLAIQVQEEKHFEVAEEILDYVIKHHKDGVFEFSAYLELQKIYINTYPKSEYTSIRKSYEKLIKKYKNIPDNLSLYLDYAYFIGFKLDDTKGAISFLKSTLKKQFFTKIEQARIEILLADILIFEERFNQALIYYSKAKKKVKNHPIAQEASFKIAKASYYKGDFQWAQTQLDVLKASTTQLIANDAMNLSLLIEDNTQEDTLFTALQLYAKADLYTFQQQPKKAMQLYEEIEQNYKGNQIEDDALFAKAQIFIAENNIKAAQKNLEKLILFFPESLWCDDAHYLLGVAFRKQGNLPKAKEHFQKLIFDYADSIYYVDAQKAFRKLRGDQLE